MDLWAKFGPRYLSEKTDEYTGRLYYKISGLNWPGLSLYNTVVMVQLTQKVREIGLIINLKDIYVLFILV